ncbi:MAG: sigma-54-dependent transcriptional regulator [Brevinema sp.]
MPKKMILVIDDEENIRNGLVLSLKSEGYNVQSANNGKSGLEKINLFMPDAVICDVKMDDINGLDLLKQVKSIHNHIPIIMLTGHAGLDDAIYAMKIGAYDFLTKPVHLDKLFPLIKRAIDDNDHTKSLEELTPQEISQQQESHIIGTSQQTLKLIEKIKQIAPTDATVLLLGESGVGKEVFASAIHTNSKRADKTFIKVHCGALPETLLESELFGHEKGAFTGATARRKGRFERANGGTIFLDEIGEISPHVQIKLLRVLQEKEFERVGGEETITTDIRIIAATNKNLLEAVKKGEFREDLYYRLSVIELTINPLRERLEDITLLADSFLKNFSQKYDKPATYFSHEVLEKFMHYSWPGNIRELQNAVETAVVLSNTKEIGLNSLPDKFMNF